MWFDVVPLVKGIAGNLNSVRFVRFDFSETIIIKIFDKFRIKDVRTAFYTTNAIESLNSCYRRLNKQRSVFPSSQALMKALYLSTFEIAKK